MKKIQSCHYAQDWPVDPQLSNQAGLKRGQDSYMYNYPEYINFVIHGTFNGGTDSSIVYYALEKGCIHAFYILAWLYSIGHLQEE